MLAGMSGSRRDQPSELTESRKVVEVMAINSFGGGGGGGGGSVSSVKARTWIEPGESKIRKVGPAGPRQVNGWGGMQGVRQVVIDGGMGELEPGFASEC